MSNKKALIAMSGGVDSSVAAYLAQQSGLSCAGGTMLLWHNESGHDPAADAKAVAQRLGMDFYVLDNREAFCALVVEPFIRCYEEGNTPNPCIFCNKHLKFDLLLTQALELGYDYVVTGHYASIRYDENTGRYLLYKAKDTAKDQSYFLACLNQYQLSHTKFPLGDLSKEQVRQIATEQNFVTAHKKDSQDICFIPDGDYVSFMKRYTKKHYPEGDFLDLNGKKVGRHTGAVSYTLGQRKGLGLAMGAPVYVCSKDMANNTVTVGPDEALYHRSLIATEPNWFPFETLSSPIQVSAKVRYRHTPQAATVTPLDDGSIRVDFDTPQRAITPGQAVVLYQEDMVVGSATIQTVL